MNGNILKDNLNNELNSLLNNNKEVIEHNDFYAYELDKVYKIYKNGKIEVARLPKEYQEVEYIESTGTQYIDTGIKANSESLLYLKCTFNISNTIVQDTSQAGWVYGTEKHQSGGVISGGLACSTYSSSGKISVNFYSNSHDTIDMVNNTKNTLEINSTEIIANGISYPFTGTFQGGALDQNIYLFCLCGYGGNRYYYSSSKIYGFQFGYSKNNLVIDLVPVYDTVTQKYGMYDKVSQTFKGNSGSGNFTGGKDLNPPANVIFDEVDNNNYITYKTQDGQSYWRKSYSGLCYGGFCVFEDGGNNWIVAFTISEVQNNCIMYRDSNQNITLTISSTALNYKGKNWYYSINGYANIYNNPSSTIIDFNKNNGRYWIGGENKIYTGSDNNEKFIKVAKDFLDYIYSF